MSKGTTTTTQEAQVPEYLQSLFTEYAQRAKEASDIPFVGYTGDRIAGLSPEEAQAQAAAQGLFGTAFGFDPTAQLQTLAGQAIPTAADVPSLLDVDLGAYQSPYQQQVIDLALEDIGRAEDIQRQQAQDVAMRAGAFGGSRGTIYEQEALRPLQEEKLRTVAGLRQAGFEQAQRAAEADIARQQQMAMFAPEMELRGRAQQAGLLGSLLGGQQQALGTLAGFGGLGRGLSQAERDFAFQEFMREQQQPGYQLGLLGQAVRTLPQSLIGQTTTQETQAGPLGFLGGLAGLGSSFALQGINPFSGLGGLFGSTTTPTEFNLPSALPGAGTGLPGTGLVGTNYQQFSPISLLG